MGTGINLVISDKQTQCRGTCRPRLSLAAIGFAQHVDAKNLRKKLPFRPEKWQVGSDHPPLSPA